MSIKGIMTTRLYYDQSMWIRLAHRLYSDFQYFFIVATLLGFSVPSVPMLLGFAVPMVPTLRLTSVCGVGQAWYSDKQPTQRSRTASLGQRPRSTHILVYTLQQPGFWGHKGNARAFRIACIQRSNALSHIRHIFIWKVRVQYMPFIKCLLNKLA